MVDKKSEAFFVRHFLSVFQADVRFLLGCPYFCQVSETMTKTVPSIDKLKIKVNWKTIFA